MYTRKPLHVWLFLGTMTLFCLVVGLLDITLSEPKPMLAESSLIAQAPSEPPALATSPLGNHLRNPGFEEGKEPWFSMETWKTNFSLSTQMRHSGTQSAVLVLDSRQEGSPRGSRVYGVVQEVRPAQFPEKISGYYYVEQWQQGTPLQYIQFVVGVVGAKNIPPSVDQVNNHQIRYVLAGVDQPPVPMSNVKYILLAACRREPKIGIF